MNRYGRQIHTRAKESPAGHFMATCNGILERQELRLPESISSGILLLSYVGTQERQ